MIRKIAVRVLKDYIFGKEQITSFIEVEDILALIKKYEFEVVEKELNIDDCLDNPEKHCRGPKFVKLDDRALVNLHPKCEACLNRCKKL